MSGLSRRDLEAAAEAARQSSAKALAWFQRAKQEYQRQGARMERATAALLAGGTNETAAIEAWRELQAARAEAARSGKEMKLARAKLESSGSTMPTARFTI